MKTVLKENIVKNIIIVLLLVPAYFMIQNSLFFSTISNDKSVLGSLLVGVSILAVTACFGNFAFTYEKVEHHNLFSRFLAHVTTGGLMLLIGISLEMTSVITHLLIGNFVIFDLSLILLYFTSVLYDFWDLKRANIASS